MLVSLPLLLSVVCSAAAFSQDKSQSITNVVKIKHGTVVGSAADGVVNFMGIPYVQPPTGTRRLRPPQSITKDFGTLTATGTPTACPQPSASLDVSTLPSAFLADVAASPTIQKLTAVLLKAIPLQGEDCLTLNIQRPEGIPLSVKLPVLFWIHGGAFETGTGHAFDGTSLVQKSLEVFTPFIFVSINYRLSAFGFLPGKEMQQDGSTNLGLRDQRSALEWVQENIKAFGGDPERVTIWGESAGSWSVFDHLLVNNGNNTYKSGKLFRAAIMDSGAAFPASSVSAPKAQQVYNQVVRKAGCTGSVNTLDCLRSVKYEAFLNASNSFPSSTSYQSLNQPYVVRPDPVNSFFARPHYDSIRRGSYTKVPIIAGNQQDEGTLFTIFAKNVTTNSDVQDFFTPWFPNVTQSQLTGLIATYSEDQAAGSPFGTGQANQLFGQFKRLAAILGDYCFILARRIALRDMSCSLPATYSYLATYFDGLPGLGTTHGTDVALLSEFIGPSIPREELLVFITSFVTHLDPNKVQSRRLGRPMPTWPKYTAASPDLLVIGTNSTKVEKDDFRGKSYDYLSKHRDSFHL